MLIKQIGEGLMKIISRRRWSYSQPGRQITVKNSHVNRGKVPRLNINFSRRAGGMGGGGGGEKDEGGQKDRSGLREESG